MLTAQAKKRKGGKEKICSKNLRQYGAKFLTRKFALNLKCSTSLLHVLATNLINLICCSL